MIKHFYSYHVEIDTVIIEINSLDISDEEKKHLISLAESHVHHSVLDTVLSQLEHEDKKTFIEHLNSKNHEKTWQFLTSKIDGVEKKIEEAVSSIKKELLADLRAEKKS